MPTLVVLSYCMKSKHCSFIYIFFFLLTALSSQANLNAPPQLIGVDNVTLPNDSLMLMNSLLVDYHVDYDIAITTKNTNEIANSLHKIGLVYLRLEQLDLASNYAWRLLNVSEKYALKNQTLFAYALLYKVNKQKGSLSKANSFLRKYNESFSKINEVDLQNTWNGVLIENRSKNLDLAKEELIDTREVKPEAIKLSEIEHEASFVKKPMVYIWIAAFMLTLIFLWKGNVIFTKNVYHFSDAGNQKGKAQASVIEIEPVKEISILGGGEKKQEVLQPQVNEEVMQVNKEELEIKTLTKKEDVIVLKREDRKTEKPNWLMELEKKVTSISDRTDVKLSMTSVGLFSQLSDEEAKNIDDLVFATLPMFLKCSNLNTFSLSFIDNQYGFVCIMNGFPVNTEFEIMDSFTLNAIQKRLRTMEGLQVYANREEANSVKLVVKTYYPSTNN